MAAWILTTSPELSAFNNYRLLVAQDRHEIYLVYASYRCDYLRYLKGDGPVTPKAFLTMRANAIGYKECGRYGRSGNYYRGHDSCREAETMTYVSLGYVPGLAVRIFFGLCART
jgi:hypothetical protein